MRRVIIINYTWCFIAYPFREGRGTNLSKKCCTGNQNEVVQNHSIAPPGWWQEQWCIHVYCYSSTLSLTQMWHRVGDYHKNFSQLNTKNQQNGFTVRGKIAKQIKIVPFFQRAVMNRFVFQLLRLGSTIGFEGLAVHCNRCSWPLEWIA